MLRSSISSLRLGTSRWASPGGASPWPDPVHAVLTLEDASPAYGQPGAILASLSHPALEPLGIVLTNWATIQFGEGDDLAESSAFEVEAGGDPYQVSVDTWDGGGFASLDVSDTATIYPPADVEPVRVYKGSLVYSASGSVAKSDILAQSFLSGATPSALEVEFEAVGAGASGSYQSTDGQYGGRPGAVSKATRAWAEVPSTVTYTVGAGGTGDGGASSVSGIVSAAGGVRLVSPLSPKDRPTGPGQGSSYPRGDDEAKRGGKANAADSALAVDGGTGGATSRPSTNGHDAATPFQHGGGAAAVNGAATGAGIGGWPGGGGGSYSVAGGTNPRGGHGAVRLHVYAWEIPA